MKKFFLWAVLPFVLMACSSSDNEDGSLKQSHYSVNYEESIAFDNPGSLAIENTFIASYADGMISGRHIGETEAIYDGKQRLTIIVNETIHYLDWPVTEWGASQSTVKDLQKSGVIESDSDDENIFYAIKSGSKTKYLYGYTFKEGKLSASILFVPVSEVKTIVPWLMQKYYIALTGDDTIFSGGYDANNLDEATTILGVTMGTLDTSRYTTKYAYALLFTSADEINTRADSFDNILKALPIELTTLLPRRSHVMTTLSTYGDFSFSDYLCTAKQY